MDTTNAGIDTTNTFECGDVVWVYEPGVDAWSGTIIAVKVSPSGIRYDVLDENGFAYSIPARYVRDE